MASETAMDDARWLIGEEGRVSLAQAADWDGPLVAQVARLRRNLSAERAHLVLEQVGLRRRGREKFALAERMFFTKIGLEQATDDVVARYKAARLPAQQPRVDFCCGIGGDLMSLAADGPTLGVDRDPVTSLFAEANLRAAGRRDTAVRCVDMGDLTVESAAAWHLDPDRRPSGRRTTRVELHEPGPEAIRRLLTANPNGAVKLAPAAVWPEDWTDRAELEWISRDGECRQLVVWFGALAVAPGRRAATVLARDGTFRQVVGEVAEVPVAERVGRYVYEPDAAVLAAKLTAALAVEHELMALSPEIAYLTGDKVAADSALAAFEVREVLPFDMKRLKAELRTRGIGRLEVKKRGVDCDPARICRELRNDGEAAGTLIVSPLAGSMVAILAHRLQRLNVQSEAHNWTL